MNKAIEMVGNAAGGVGLLACAGTGLSRLVSGSYVGEFQTMVLFNVGVGLMVAACLAKLHVLGAGQASAGDKAPSKSG